MENQSTKLPAHTASLDQGHGALTSACLRDVLFLAAGWDLVRLLVLFPLFANNARGATVLLLIKAVLVEAIPFLLWRSGRLFAAAWLMGISAAVIDVVYILLSGGLRSSGVVTMVGLVILTAIILEYRGLFTIGLTALLFLGALAGWQSAGHTFPLVFPESAWMAWFNMLSAATLVFVPAARMLRNMRGLGAERSRIASDLTRSRADLNDLINALEGIVWECDARTWKFSFVSQKAERLLGYPVAAWIEDPDFWINHLHPADREWAPGACRAAAAGGKDHTFEYRMIAADGREVWLRDLVTVISEDGQPRLLRGLLIDITERKQAQQQLQEKEHHLRAMLESEPACVKLLDAEGRILEMNPAGMAMTEADGPDQVIGKSVCAILSHEHHNVFLERNRKVFTGEPFTMEYEIQGFKGTKRWLETHATPLRDRDGNVTAALSVTRDVTERKNLERELRLANSRLMQAKTIAKLGYFVEDLASGRTEFSDELFRIFRAEVPENGAAHSELERLLFPEGILYGDLERVRAGLNHLRREGCEMDVTYVLQDSQGDVRHIHVKAERESDAEGRPLRVFGVVQDITEHRQVLELLHRLTAHQETVREEERRRIAREIHDELGQQLTGLKMQTAWADHLLQSDLPAARAELDSIGHQLEATIRTVRRIVTDLRPPVLDTLGLIPALEWLRENFQRDHGTSCVTALEEVRVSPDVATAVFRVAQEALTNVAKHAGATKVEIRLRKQGDHLLLDVDDNGPGMRETIDRRRNSFGLIGMQERARLLNGTIDFLTSESGGVLLRLTLPQAPEKGSHVFTAHR
ncbi:MAG: PAS domain S-box protein [Bryobacteraceae bacterium]